MLVIVILLSSILIVYSRSGEYQIILFRDQAKVIGAIFKAKSLAIETFGQAGAVPCSYGVHFDQASGSYVIFQDLPASSGDCSTANNQYDGPNSGELVQAFQLDSVLKFSSLTLSDVVFIPPNPDVIITPSQNQAVITISTVSGGSSTNIKVTESGQITTN